MVFFQYTRTDIICLIFFFSRSLPQPSSSFISVVLVSTQDVAFDRLEELEGDHYKVVDHLLAVLDNLLIHIQCSGKCSESEKTESVKIALTTLSIFRSSSLFHFIFVFLKLFYKLFRTFIPFFNQLRRWGKI